MIVSNCNNASVIILLQCEPLLYPIRRELQVAGAQFDMLRTQNRSFSKPASGIATWFA